MTDSNKEFPTDNNTAFLDITLARICSAFKKTFLAENVNETAFFDLTLQQLQIGLNCKNLPALKRYFAKIKNNLRENMLFLNLSISDERLTIYESFVNFYQAAFVVRFMVAELSHTPFLAYQEDLRALSREHNTVLMQINSINETTISAKMAMLEYALHEYMNTMNQTGHGFPTSPYSFDKPIASELLTELKKRYDTICQDHDINNTARTLFDALKKGEVGETIENYLTQLNAYAKNINENLDGIKEYFCKKTNDSNIPNFLYHDAVMVDLSKKKTVFCEYLEKLKYFEYLNTLMEYARCLAMEDKTLQASVQQLVKVCKHKQSYLSTCLPKAWCADEWRKLGEQITTFQKEINEIAKESSATYLTAEVNLKALNAQQTQNINQIKTKMIFSGQMQERVKIAKEKYLECTQGLARTQQILQKYLQIKIPQAVDDYRQHWKKILFGACLGGAAGVGIVFLTGMSLLSFGILPAAGLILGGAFTCAYYLYKESHPKVKTKAKAQPKEERLPLKVESETIAPTPACQNTVAVSTTPKVKTEIKQSENELSAWLSARKTLTTTLTNWFWKEKSKLVLAQELPFSHQHKR